MVGQALETPFDLSQPAGQVLAIVLFLIVHVSLALMVPRSLLAMLTGGPVLKPDEPISKAGMAPPVAPDVAG